MPSNRIMIHTGITVLVASLIACQSAKPQEQIAAEQAAAAARITAVTGGTGAGTSAAPPGQDLDPQQLAAAMRQAQGQIDPQVAAAAAMYGAAVDSELTAEERAKMRAISAGIASGTVHPAVAAYLAGFEKVLTLLSTVKDEAGANAVRPQLVAVFAQMKGPSAQLQAMTEDEREVAILSAYAHWMTLSNKMMPMMMALSSKPGLAETVQGLMDDMPQLERSDD